MIARRPSGEQTQTTYRELRDRAHRAALLLATRGIKPGDRVLLIGENSPDWVLGYFAILCAGAIAVPLDQLISAEELAPICKIAEPAAALRSSTVHKRLGAALKDAHPKLIELDLAELARPFILRGDAKTPPAPPERKALASILFTSGSTGAPKGVMLSHGNFAAEVAMLSRVFSLGADDVVLSLLAAASCVRVHLRDAAADRQRRDDRLSARGRCEDALAHARRRSSDRADWSARRVGGGPSANRR